MLAWYRASTTTFSRMTVVMKALKSLLSTARRASCMQEGRCAYRSLAQHEAGSTSNNPDLCKAARRDSVLNSSPCQMQREGSLLHPRNPADPVGWHVILLWTF